VAPKYPKDLSRLESTFKPQSGSGMQVNWFGDIGSSPDPGSRYVLRWETLGRNRDRPRKGKLPENGQLVLYRLSASK